MCGRVRLSSEFSQIRIRLRVDDIFPAPNYRSRWNLPPSENLLCVIRDRERGTRKAGLMRWAPSTQVTHAGDGAESVRNAEESFRRRLMGTPHEHPIRSCTKLLTTATPCPPMTHSRRNVADSVCQTKSSRGLVEKPLDGPINKVELFLDCRVTRFLNLVAEDRH